MGRADLIGNGRRHLVPAYQPAGTGEAGAGARIAALPHPAHGAAAHTARSGEAGPPQDFLTLRGAAAPYTIPPTL